jgi:hypothetical protein
MGMKRRFMAFMVFSVLSACGRSDQPSFTGNEIPEGTPGVMWLPGRESTPFPTPTAYVPIVHGTLVEIDAAVLGHRPAVAFTIHHGQVLHLTASLHDLPYFEWFIDVDPSRFSVAIDGQPHTPVQGYEAYPPNGVVLTPLHKGTYSFRVHLRLDPCTNCDTVSHSTIYTITID